MFRFQCERKNAHRCGRRSESVRTHKFALFIIFIPTKKGHGFSCVVSLFAMLLRGRNLFRNINVAKYDE